MAYEKQNFRDGDTLTADKLEKMEDGIIGAYASNDGWEYLGKQVHRVDEYEVLSYANGVVTLAAIDGAYPQTANNFTSLFLKKDLSGSINAKLVATDIAGQFKLKNLDGADYTPSEDLTQYVFMPTHSPKTSIVFDNVAGYDYYKMRVFCPFLSTHGSRASLNSNYGGFQGLDGNDAGRLNAAVLVEMESLPAPIDGRVISKTLTYSARNYGNSCLPKMAILNRPANVSTITVGHYNALLVNNTVAELWGRKA